ncbi:sugar ABC transporter ATP-binding protein [Mesorhizobium sp. L-8-3]|uniref:sugar ABC transporter ATP-binding protein n=1 Tax=Mesorhizobium sp. L-8-3 TaxID=2744522 RepID=UPI00192898FD|nr:sugar ABC transporter ATP-binding protein [Mesorhizobium sp. L-8-3]BCH23657.1 ABC transporter ATP-binding protein [Mesorhizobium sp. L-8-3]
MVSLIQMSGVSKAFGSSVALDDVSLELFPGSVHALMGENGAGKSTLMKILAGVVQPDRGTVHLNGRELRITGPREALDAGISTVFQELSLLPNLTIAENMFLGREPTTAFGTVDGRLMERRAGSTLKELGLELDPATLVSELTIAERQFVEIARGIFANTAVVILDEPTAALNSADVETLNRHIRRLKEQGKAIVYISHRMDEIFDICDTVTVLKDGRKVATRPIREVTPQSLVALMVGREIKDLFPRRGAPGGQPILTLEDLRLAPDAAPIALTLSRGEIVALAGLEGQGQREILRSLIGRHQPHGGTLTVKGDRIDLPMSPSGGVRQMQAMGMGFVPEDRKDEGLFLGLPLAHNISIGLHTAQPDLSLARRYQKIVAGTLSRLGVKAAGPGAPAGSLSGGNQQKVLLGRYLASGADILLIEEPTRGVDIGAKAEIYRLLRNFADDGGAILILSRETIELIGLCDRILVVHGRTIVGDMPAGEATEHNILDAALIA